MQNPGKVPGSDALKHIYDEQFFAQHAKSMPAFRELARLIDKSNAHDRNKSIIDIGCGHGFLVESLRLLGYSETYGFEGSASAQELWPGQFRSFYTLGDLTDAESGRAIRKTDIVCSFEVAEHIEHRYAKQFVQFLTQHQPDMIAFSAATVLQDLGNNPTHVNEQPFSYWIELFKDEHYELDILGTVEIRNSMCEKPEVFCMAWWYPKNILIFRPKSTEALVHDQEIANLVRSKIQWLDIEIPNPLLNLCFLRDRHEYHYLIMDAITKSLHRLSE